MASVASDEQKQSARHACSDDAVERPAEKRSGRNAANFKSPLTMSHQATHTPTQFNFCIDPVRVTVCLIRLPELCSTRPFASCVASAALRLPDMHIRTYTSPPGPGLGLRHILSLLPFGIPPSKLHQSFEKPSTCIP